VFFVVSFTDAFAGIFSPYYKYTGNTTLGKCFCPGVSVDQGIPLRDNIKCNHYRACKVVNFKMKTADGKKLNALIASCLLCMLLLIACSFDYGAGTGLENTRPDIVMENIEYVRVRGGDMLARFQAEHAVRWEEQMLMELKNLTFEQMEDHGETVNVEGAANVAAVQIDSGDISLWGGVRISIQSEDITINTTELEWKDKEKAIIGGEEEEVEVQRSDGTNFTGRGFSADVRSRTWSFSGEVNGSYVEKDEDEKEEG
jgi:LPS export ABC transporter protein LptC